LIRTLVAYLCRTPIDERPDAFPSSLPWWAIRENHFRASHAGMDAMCLVDVDGGVEHLRRTVERVFEIILPTARSLGESAHLQRLARMLSGRLGYERQRAALAETSSMVGVCRALADELSAELANLGRPSC
jgi:glutamate---cysteine ligase / carboxylate-amine ligase